MDSEKIIKGLELCEIGSGDRCYETECPYYGQECTEGLKNDILAMLKEQEAVEPITMQRMDGNFSFFVPYYLCGNCRYELVGKDVMFCSHCGQAVKRE